MLNSPTAPGTIRLAGRNPALAMAVLLGSYLLLTSTVTLYEGVFVYDVKRVLQLLIFPVLFATTLIVPPLRLAFQQRIRQLSGWKAGALLLILTLGILSSIVHSSSAMSLFYSLAEVSLLAMLFASVLVVAACRAVAGAQFDRAVLLFLSMVGVAVGLQELLGVLAALEAGVEFHSRVALLHFSWPRFYNQVQSWSIPAIAALPLVFPGKPLARLLCTVALALEWYVVIATGGRGTMLSVGLALLLVLVFLLGMRKTMIACQLSGIIAGALIYGIVVLGHQQLPGHPVNRSAAASQSVLTERSLSEPREDENAKRPAADDSGKFMDPLVGQRVWSSSGRIAMWRDALSEIPGSPLLGIGPMAYACTSPINQAAHPHNFPLQFALEWGIPAFLLLAVLAGSWIWKLQKSLCSPGQQEEPDRALAGFFACGVLAALCHACLSGVLVMPASQLTGVLVCGTLVGLVRPRNSDGRGATAGGTIFLVCCLLVSLALLEFARKEMAVAAIRLEQTAVMDQAIPRFWQNGKVCRLYR